MRLVTVKEAAGLEPGEIVPAITGNITFIGDHKSGGEGDRTWSMQIVEVSDGTGKIGVKLWDRPTVQRAAKGAAVFIQSVKAKKGNGLVGIKVEESEYKGKPQKKLSVSSAAELRIGDQIVPVAQADDVPPDAEPQEGDSSHPELNPASSPSHAPQTAPQGSVAQAQAVPQAASGNPVIAKTPEDHSAAMDSALAKFAKQYLRCLDAADWVQQQRAAAGKPVMTQENYQACVSSLFIKCDRNGY